MRALLRRPAFMATLLAVLLPAHLPSQESVQLRYQLEVGQTYRTRIVTESESSQTVQGMTQDNRQRTSMDLAMDVLEHTAQGTRIRHRYEAIQAVVDGSMGHMEYDSSNPDAAPVPQPLKAYAALSGASFEMLMGPDGAVVSMSGLDALLERMVSDMDLPPGPASEMVRESLEKQFGDEGMAQTMRSVMPPLPQEPQSVGDTWSHTGSGSMGMPVTLESTFTVARIEDGVAYLDTQATFLTDSTSVQAIGSMTQTFNLTGETTGTTEIDVATGMTLRSRTEGTIMGTVTVSGPMGEMAIPMTTTTVTTTEVLSGG